MKKCPKCGAANPDEFSFCGFCGASLGPDTIVWTGVPPRLDPSTAKDWRVVRIAVPLGLFFFITGAIVGYSSVVWGSLLIIIALIFFAVAGALRKGGTLG